MKRFLLSRPLGRDEQRALFEHWPYYRIDDERVLAFSAPQEPLPVQVKLTESGGASWPDVQLIDNVRATNVVGRRRSRLSPYLTGPQGVHAKLICWMEVL